VVVKTGVFPLIRLALLVPEIDPIVRIFGVGTAFLGVFYALFEKDSKRMLAFSTISQLGFILAAPAVGGFYALSHGLVKSTLFLCAGTLPSRNFQELRHQSIALPLRIVLLMASFSISGVPLFAGFGAKILTLKELLPWQEIAMNVDSVGTAIYFGKFIFLPLDSGDLKSNRESGGKEIPRTFWLATIVLIGGLILANGLDIKAYTVANIAKSLITIAIGWSVYFAIFQRLFFKLPRVIEELEHLIGVMSLVLIGLFLMVLSIVMP